MYVRKYVCIQRMETLHRYVSLNLIVLNSRI